MNEDNDPYEYEPFDSENASRGELYTGDQCPNCGDPLKSTNLVYDEMGHKSTVRATEHEMDAEPLWCKDCWQKIAPQVKGQQNHQLYEYK